jgi:hypothetical protein
MAGLAVASGLNGRVKVALATLADDRGICDLLRTTPIGGEVRLAFCREPSFFYGAAVEGEPTAVVVARTEDDRIVGLGSRSVMDVFIDGTPRRVGYLSLMRLAEGYRNRARIVRAGFAALGGVRRLDEELFDVVSVVADNRVARRLLEAGILGLPRLSPLARFVTRVVPIRREIPLTLAGIVLEPAEAAALPEIASCLERSRRRLGLARRFTLEELRCPRRSRGLSPGDFIVARRAGQVVACAAVWDQTSFKQVLVSDYEPVLRRWRRTANLLSPLMGTPRLPAPGNALQLAYVSHLAVDDDDPRLFQVLWSAVVSSARKRGFEQLVAGFASTHPLLPALRRTSRAREYESILYAAHGDAAGESAIRALEGRPVHLEVALL